MLPHELAAKHLAAPLRALVAQILRGMGLGQERIAKLLGVSQAMVSRYLRRSRGELLAQLHEAGVEEAEAEAVAAALAGMLARGDQLGYLTLATEFVNSVLSRGGLCRLHMERYGAPTTCRICMDMFPSARDPYVEEVEEAAKLFTSREGSYRLVPNVGSNIVAARPGARARSDVVGLTGGLVRVGERIEIVGKPVYGGSGHTASVLLLVHSRWPRLRAAVVARLNEACIEALRRRGLRVLEAGPHSSPEKLLDEIAEALKRISDPPDAIADRGGVALEPILYVFASNAVEAVEMLLNTCL